MHAFAAHARAAPIAALRNLVDLVDEDDAVLLARVERFGFDLLVVDEMRGLLLHQQRTRSLDRELALLRLVARHLREHAAQLVGHLLHARRRHDLDADIDLGFDLDFAIFERTFAQLLAQLLARVRVERLRRRLIPARRAARNQCIEDALFGAILGLRLYRRLGRLARHLHRDIGKIAHDLLDILADITNLGELGRFDLDERRIRKRCQTPSDLGLADAGRPDHQNVFRRDLVAQRRIELHAPPAVAQRDRDRALGRILADDETVEFADDFAGGE